MLASQNQLGLLNNAQRASSRARCPSDFPTVTNWCSTQDDAAIPLGARRTQVSHTNSIGGVTYPQRVGEIPLPPYISREQPSRESPEDAERYQTIYARVPGSAAAPTAGLHLEAEAIEQLEAAGIELLRLTLHIGLDTFKPLSSEALESGRLHGETVEISSATARKLQEARSEKRRVIAVGTTTTRALESFADSGFPAPFRERTHLFIRPPRKFKLVDGLITNFHLPRSSLLMLVSSLAGRERILAAYREAINNSYRFFSYGDAMLLSR